MESKYFELFTEQTITEETLNGIDIKTQSIIIPGRRGKWSLIDVITGKTIDGKNAHIGIFGLFENDHYGDLTDYVLAYFDFYSRDNNWKEIDGTCDDIITALYDASIIENCF